MKYVDLQISDPEDGCEELAVPPVKDAWIALITRSQKDNPSTCSFNIKVRTLVTPQRIQ